MGTHESIKEKHFFLENGTKNIYCVEYLPVAETDKKYGVVLCKSIWGERNRSHRIFTNLSRELALHGFSVITCDYFGDGNSGGDTLDMTFDSMVNDIISMYSYLKNRHNLVKMSLVGFRIGANCVIEAQSKVDSVAKVLLIEPELNLIDFLKKKLRSNVSNQMAVYKKILKTREDLIQDIHNGIPANMDGSLLGHKLWQSFDSRSPLKGFPKNYDNFTMLSLVHKGKKSKVAGHFKTLLPENDTNSIFTIEKEFIWEDWKKYIPKPVLFIETILNELSVN